jgi:hypothetical protein
MTNLQSNLKILAKHKPETYHLISGSLPSPEVKMVLSKTGHPIPVVAGKALHSTYDPVREGNRFPSMYQPDGFIIFFGLGSGYHIRPFLDKESVSGILIIVESIPVFRAMLEITNLQEILSSPVIQFILGPSADVLRNTVLSNYLPVLHGTLRTVPLRPAVKMAESFFRSAAKTVEEALAYHKKDYAVQSHFGLAWFRNIVKNFSVSHAKSSTVHPLIDRNKIREVIITAAGPTLEKNLSRLKARGQNGFLIATDTSLPALLSAGISPGLVITMDCQFYSVHHFLKPASRKVPLFADGAVHPLIIRRSRTVTLFNGGHPLLNYFSRNFVPMLQIDTSGGNITQTALSAAELFAPEEVIVYGADFGYPGGKPYARETYLYRYFAGIKTRVKPEESMWFNLLMDQGAWREPESKDNFYTTPIMSDYHQRFKTFAGTLGTNTVRRITERGDEIIPASGKIKKKKVPDSEINGKTSRKFLLDYLEKIRSLPLPDLNQIHQNSETEKVWTTLLPLAAYRKKYSGIENREELLKEVRKEAAGIIENYLNTTPA